MTNLFRCRVARILAPRHSLTLLGVITLPTPLLASTCATLRPAWDQTAATAQSEAVFLLTTPFGMAVCGLFVLSVLTRTPARLIISAIASAGLGFMYSMREGLEGSDSPTQLALQEGCVGPTTLAVAICVGFCVISSGLLLMKLKTGATDA